MVKFIFSPLHEIFVPCMTVWRTRLEEFGFECEFSEKPKDWERGDIINIYPCHLHPPVRNAIGYYTEEYPEYGIAPEWKNNLVWCHSKEYTEIMKQQGFNVLYNDMLLTRVPESYENTEEYEIGFCGTITDRRKQVLDFFAKNGTSVFISKNMEDMRKCKVVLHIASYFNTIQNNQHRLYQLPMSCFVGEEDSHYKKYIINCPIQSIYNETMTLLKNPKIIKKCRDDLSKRIIAEWINFRMMPFEDFMNYFPKIFKKKDGDFNGLKNCSSLENNYWESKLKRIEYLEKQSYYIVNK